MIHKRSHLPLTKAGGLLLRGTHQVEFSHQNLVIPALPSALENIKLVHISDIHFGLWLTEPMLARVVEQVNELRPDVVILTGDYVGYEPEPALPCARILGGLRAPMIATLGNHDHWAGAEEVSHAFTRSGIPVLRNEWLALSLRGENLYFVGIDDLHTHHHNAERAFRGVPEAGPVLCLSHVPEGADLPEAKRASAVFSGHTHGGQIQIPKLTSYLLRRIGMRYISGHYPLGDDRHLFVNRGLGAAAFPLRYSAQPEVGVFTLLSGR
jgi:predicted MPP superfamily phosphohydrolase